MLRIRSALTISCLGLVLGLASSLPASAAIYYYSAILNPRQESPLVPSGALGGGRFIIDTQANTVNYWISWAGLSSTETSAHIHQGAYGVNGVVKHTLPSGNPKVGQWTYAEADEAAILSGNTYANIHSINFPGGEMRGQIVQLNALLDANQESPVNASTGTGWAAAMVDTALNQISYRVFYENLSGAPTLSHFHGNGFHKANVGVKVGLTVTASPMIGTVGYNQADEVQLLSGRWYVNLHTAANPGGEIRGQMVPRVVPMDALQETPVNFSLGSAAFAMVTIDTLLNAISYDMRTLALSSAETMAHIHGFAALGANGPAQHTIALGSPAIGTWAYGAANEAAVLGGQSYFNIHTGTNPDGEIRGQVFGLPGHEALLDVDDVPLRPGVALTASPNPASGRFRLSLQLARGGSASLAIIGVDGRQVRSLASGTFEAGPHSFDWDGRDASGSAVAPGIYFAVARTPAGTHVTRLARLQ